jgi:hypothetical protein
MGCSVIKIFLLRASARLLLLNYLRCRKLLIRRSDRWMWPAVAVAHVNTENNSERIKIATEAKEFGVR